MSYKKIDKKDYKGEPVQYVGYYVLKSKDLQLPEPEVFFVEEDKEELPDVKINPNKMAHIEKGAKFSIDSLFDKIFYFCLMILLIFMFVVALSGCSNGF
jgi:hypothetical protein